MHGWRPRMAIATERWLARISSDTAQFGAGSRFNNYW